MEGHPGHVAPRQGRQFQQQVDPLIRQHGDVPTREGAVSEPFRGKVVCSGSKGQSEGTRLVALEGVLAIHRTDVDSSLIHRFSVLLVPQGPSDAAVEGHAFHGGKAVHPSPSVPRVGGRRVVGVEPPDRAHQAIPDVRGRERGIRRMHEGGTAGHVGRCHGRPGPRGVDPPRQGGVDADSGGGNEGDHPFLRPVHGGGAPVEFLDDLAAAEGGDQVVHIRSTDSERVETVPRAPRAAEAAVAGGRDRDRPGEVAIPQRIDHLAEVAQGAPRHAVHVRRQARGVPLIVGRVDTPLDARNDLGKGSASPRQDEGVHERGAWGHSYGDAAGLPPQDGARGMSAVALRVMRRGTQNRISAVVEFDPTPRILRVSRDIAPHPSVQIRMGDVDTGV